MKQHSITSDEIIERTLMNIASLPCQQAYIKQLATILSMHIHKNELMDQGYLSDDLPPVSAIVVAPTGQGKTFLLRKMAETMKINFIVVDCSTLAAEGWKGVGLAQRLWTAYKEASTKESFERSVLLLDEVDKLRLWGTGNDQGNPMSNILQLYNAGYVTAEGSGKEAVSIDIRRFTVLLGGAFDGISSFVEKRLYRSIIGFTQCDNSRKISKAELMQQVTNEDLAAYGMLPELLGRIGTILTIPPLGVEDYRQLLCADRGSIQAQYHNYLRGLYGVGFALTEAAIAAIAGKCMASSSGTRAIVPIVNDLMRKAIPVVERDQTINRIVIDQDESGLLVRFEQGDRLYCYSDADWNDLPDHTIKAKTTTDLARKLCRYFKKAGGHIRVMPELQTFLECALAYLQRCTLQADFCFHSLEKLARLVYRGADGSSFEELLYAQDMESYRRFQEHYTTSTPKNLITALQLIMEYLESYHKKVNVRFLLKKKRM